MTAFTESRRLPTTRRNVLPALMVVLAAVGCTSKVGPTTTSPSIAANTTTSTSAPAIGALGPERVPIPDGPPLGPINTSTYGRDIDAIKCEVTEKVVYHVHAHLAVFVDGQPRQVPLGIGIAPPIQTQSTPAGPFVSGGSCFYWLHTHASDGVIHVESPSEQIYTLGQFFDLWGQPLSAGHVGPAAGTVTAYVDGQEFTGDPRSISLANHALIQLDVGTLVPPQPIDWTPSGL